MIRFRRRQALTLLGALVVLAAATAVVQSGIVADALSPRRVATPDEVTAQQASAERAIQRAFAAAADQLKKARQLRLPISDAQAAAIEERNTMDLRTLRHNALVSLAQAYGVAGADAERYATLTAQRMDSLPVPDRNANAPVLLAPRLFEIVKRMDEIAAQISDRGVREMTVAPSPSPRPSPSP